MSKCAEHSGWDGSHIDGEICIIVERASKCCARCLGVVVEVVGDLGINVLRAGGRVDGVDVSVELFRVLSKELGVMKEELACDGA